LQEGQARTVFGEIQRQQGQVQGKGGRAAIARATLSVPDVSPEILAVNGAKDMREEVENMVET